MDTQSQPAGWGPIVRAFGDAEDKPLTDNRNDGRRRRSGASASLFSRLPVVTSSAPLGDQLYRVLEEAIINGILAPGQRLDEQELANHFGVSRIPLREALRALEVTGWIEKTSPRQGTSVRPITEAELEKLSEVRGPLDGECAALAAQRRTDDQLRALKGIAAKARTALERNDRNRVIEFNTQFHAMLASCTQNEVFEETLLKINKRVRRLLWIVDPDLLVTSAEEHEALVDAIERKDARAARTVARRHAARHGSSKFGGGRFSSDRVPADSPILDVPTR